MKEIIINEGAPLAFGKNEDGKAFLGELSKHHELIQKKKGYYVVTISGREHHVEVRDFNDAARTAVLRVDGKPMKIELRDEYDKLLKMMGMERGKTALEKDLKAPMPGLVLSIDVKSGDSVNAGDPLLILEAMKMENVIKSSRDGVIAGVHMTQGEAVEKNQVLISFE